MANTRTQAPKPAKAKRKAVAKKSWRRPTLEDVSARIMAQPYIRFT